VTGHRTGFAAPVPPALEEPECCGPQPRLFHLTYSPVVVFRGELDSTNTEHFGRVLAQAVHARRCRYVDLCGVRYMQACAVAMLLRIARCAPELLELLVVDGSAIATVLRVTGVDTVAHLQELPVDFPPQGRQEMRGPGDRVPEA
jgi:anti-anti-sigma factor